MSDRIEEFVKKNREAFDDREPSAKVWKGVENSLFPSKSFWNSVVVWRAAAMIFMALSVYLMVPKEKFSRQNQTVLKEFTETEEFYITQISEKVKLIDDFDANENGATFAQDFQQLEAMYLVLKEEMKTRPSKKVKDALVLNLLVQIDLLNQQLQRLENEQEKSESQTKSNREI